MLRKAAKERMVSFHVQHTVFPSAFSFKDEHRRVVAEGRGDGRFDVYFEGKDNSTSTPNENIQWRRRDDLPSETDISRARAEEILKMFNRRATHDLPHTIARFCGGQVHIYKP